MANARARHDERVGADPDIAADYDPLLLESLLRDQPMRVAINVVHRPYFHARSEQYVVTDLHASIGLYYVVETDPAVFANGQPVNAK